MKLLLIINLLLLSPSHIGSSTNANCEILVELLKHKEGRRLFYFDVYKQLPIVFVDTKQYFSGCTIDSFYGKEVRIIHDSIYRNEKKVQYVMIHNLMLSDSLFDLTISHPASGAFGHVYFRKSKPIVIKKFEVGHF